MPEQLMLDFGDLEQPQPEAIQESTAMTEIAPVRISRLRTSLGERAAAQAMNAKPHYELGGGVAEAIEGQEQDSLTPFAEFLENYQPHKREVAALFERFRFHELNRQSLATVPSEQKGPLSVHVVDFVDQLRRRGRVLKTEGTFGGQVAEGYGFSDETASMAYGEELISLAGIAANQPVFLQLQAMAQTFLDEWHRQRSGDQHSATDLTRRQFIHADKARNGEPQVVAIYPNSELSLSYLGQLAA